MPEALCGGSWAAANKHSIGRQIQQARRCSLMLHGGTGKPLQQDRHSSRLSASQWLMQLHPARQHYIIAHQCHGARVKCGITGPASGHNLGCNKTIVSLQHMTYGLHSVAAFSSKLTLLRPADQPRDIS